MSLGAGVFGFLSDGLSVGERVFPLTLPQDIELPALTYQVISDVPAVTHSTMQDHPTFSGVRYSDTRVQFSCYGRTYDDAEALCDELDELVIGFRGAWGDEDVQAVTPDLRLDDFDEAPDLFRVIRDHIVSHRHQPTS